MKMMKMKKSGGDGSMKGGINAMSMSKYTGNLKGVLSMKVGKQIGTAAVGKTSMGKPKKG
jgi:hypothetical protein